MDPHEARSVCIYAKTGEILFRTTFEASEPRSLRQVVERAVRSGTDLTSASLRCWNLDGADLAGARLANADLSFAHLASANLENAKLGKADLADANLDGANLTSADLARANLMHANLDSALLDQADLGKAILTYANLSLAGLYRANLAHANLAHASLWNACLEHARLDCASLEKTKIAGADLTNASLAGTNLALADLREIQEQMHWTILASPLLQEVLAKGKIARDKIAHGVLGKIEGGDTRGDLAGLAIGLIEREDATSSLLDARSDLSAEKWFRPLIVDRWFDLIRPGETPTTSQVAQITAGWIRAWLAAADPTIPGDRDTP